MEVVITDRGVVQLVEHQVLVLGAGGSNPPTPAISSPHLPSRSPLSVEIQLSRHPP